MCHLKQFFSHLALNLKDIKFQKLLEPKFKLCQNLTDLSAYTKVVNAEVEMQDVLYGGKSSFADIYRNRIVEMVDMELFYVAKHKNCLNPIESGCFPVCTNLADVGMLDVLRPAFPGCTLPRSARKQQLKLPSFNDSDNVDTLLERLALILVNSRFKLFSRKEDFLWILLKKKAKKSIYADFEKSYYELKTNSTHFSVSRMECNRHKHILSQLFSDSDIDKIFNFLELSCSKGYYLAKSDEDIPVDRSAVELVVREALDFMLDSKRDQIKARYVLPSTSSCLNYMLPQLVKTADASLCGAVCLVKEKYWRETDCLKAFFNDDLFNCSSLPAEAASYSKNLKSSTLLNDNKHEQYNTGTRQTGSVLFAYMDAEIERNGMEGIITPSIGAKTSTFAVEHGTTNSLITAPQEDSFFRSADEQIAAKAIALEIEKNISKFGAENVNYLSQILMLPLKPIFEKLSQAVDERNLRIQRGSTVPCDHSVPARRAGSVGNITAEECSAICNVIVEFVGIDPLKTLRPKFSKTCVLGSATIPCLCIFWFLVLNLLLSVA